MTDQQQQALDSFYAIDNVITIKITMPQADWDAVRTEEPAGGRCNFDWTGDAGTRGARRPRSRYPEQDFPRIDDVHRRRRQEEIVLRLDQQRQAVPAHRLRQVQRRHRPRRPKT